jgi:hypothetical protein
LHVACDTLVERFFWEEGLSDRRPLVMISFFVGPVAQLVEQRIENPRVVGSIPTQATRIQPQEIARFLGLFLF